MTMIQPDSTHRRVPPWVAIVVLVALVAIGVAGLWYFMGGASTTSIVTDPTFEPGGPMTTQWLRSPSTSGIRSTDPQKPDQWRIKEGRTWLDVARVDGKLRFQMNSPRRTWWRGGGESTMTREGDDVLRMASLISRNLTRYKKLLNLTQQQIDALQGLSGSPATDVPPEALAALMSAWPKFEKSSGREKEQAEEQIVQIVRDIPRTQAQLVEARVALIRRTLTAEQIVLFERAQTPPARPAKGPATATAPATVSATAPAIRPASVPATVPATVPAN